MRLFVAPLRAAAARHNATGATQRGYAVRKLRKKNKTEMGACKVGSNTRYRHFAIVGTQVQDRGVSPRSLRRCRQEPAREPRHGLHRRADQEAGMSVDFDAVAIALAVALRADRRHRAEWRGERRQRPRPRCPTAIVAEPTVLVYPPSSDRLLNYGPGAAQAAWPSTRCASTSTRCATCRGTRR